MGKHFALFGIAAVIVANCFHEIVAQKPSEGWIVRDESEAQRDWPAGVKPFGWEGHHTYVTCWSDGSQVFGHHLGDKKAAQRQAAKMNELKLSRRWEDELPVDERNRIHEIISGPGMTAGNYWD